MSRAKSYSVTFSVIVLSAAVVAWRLVPIAGAADGKGASVVKASATATKPDVEGRQTITIQLDIKEGYRILANPVQDANLVAVQTTVTVASAKKLQDVKIEYPAGKRKPRSGEEGFYIYEGKIEIKAVVKRSEGDISALDVTIKCFPRNNDIVCFPERIKLHIK